MKRKMGLIGLVCMAIGLLASCSEADDSGRPPADYTELIVGEWNYFQLGERVDGIATMHEYEHGCEEEEDFWGFDEENIFSDYRFDSSCHLSTEEGSYSLHGDTVFLKVTTDGIIEERALKIIALNSKLLKMSEPADDEADAAILVFKRKEE